MLNYLINFTRFTRRWHRRCLSLWLMCNLFLTASLGHAAPLVVSASVAKEYEVKAVFLYNFANFVQWPEDTFAQPDTPFYICIYGRDPFERLIDITVQNETVQERKIVVQRPQALNDIDNCQILFISNSEHENLNTIFNAVAEKPILTVSDLSNFAETGGMIQFTLNNSRVRLLINLGITREHQLNMSANLLRVSQVINDH